MLFIKYVFSKKVREEYSRQLVDKINYTDRQIEKIYENINEELTRKAS